MKRVWFLVFLLRIQCLLGVLLHPACCAHASAGWHAKRFEFEPEWDNDAEVSIAEIEFKETDSPEEVQAKLRMLEIYNKRLDEVNAAGDLPVASEQH